MSYNFALESFAKILLFFEMQVLNQKGTNSGIWFFKITSISLWKLEKL
jgi:hypothetical protein